VEVVRNPRPGEVYNLGGGKTNSCSILEAFEMVEEVIGNKQRYIYVDQNRAGDHICYYSDLRKIQASFPEWRVNKSLRQIVEEIASSCRGRLNVAAEA
jgi:CDP-paratose 2-epimerase